MNISKDSMNGGSGKFKSATLVNQKLLQHHRILNAKSSRAFTDTYNLLRTQVLQRTVDKGHNMLMVTSAISGEGKTLVAINLALSISREMNQNALLVEANLRDPRISRYLGLKSKTGLSDYLLHNKPVEDLLVKLSMGRFKGTEEEVFTNVLPAGRPIPGSTEFLASPQMTRLTEEMKGRYKNRYVIFCCPALLNAPDALAFSSHVDGIIMVTQAGKTPRDKIKKAVDMLEGRNIVGMVLNKSGVTSI